MEGPQIEIHPPNPQIIGKLWNEGPGPHRWLSNEPVAGLKFFYAHVLREPWVNINLIKPPKTQRLPDIVTIDQAQSLNLYMSEPNGNKLDNLRRFATRARSQGIKLLVVACNTASALALKYSCTASTPRTVFKVSLK